MAHVFISYAHEDEEFTDILAHRLREAGYEVWYDKGLRGGRDWPDEIARHLRESVACVVVWSPDATQSEWVKEEMHYAREVANIPVIILLYRDAALPFGFSRGQYVDFRHGRDGFEDLVAALQEHKVHPSNNVLPPNPFHPLRGVVTDPALFFDREREMRQVLELLNAGASVALIGERAVGKSSLLWALKARLEKNPHVLQIPRPPIYLNLLTVYDEEDFYGALCEQAGVPAAKGSRLARALRGKRFLLMLDEVEKMAWQGFTRHVRAQLRGLAEGEDAPFKLVLAARTPLDRLFPDSQADDATSPLAGLCKQVVLKPWDETRARAFIHDRLSKTPIRFREEDVERIIRESRGHPQSLMELAHEMYRRYTETWRNRG